MRVTTVAARVEVPGFHYWPDAAGPRGYLATRHRHLFGVEVEVRVSHSDRAVEFHDLSDAVRAWWARYSNGSGVAEWQTWSCEDIAAALADHLAQLGMVVERVAVDEDGEHTATVYAERTS